MYNDNNLNNEPNNSGIDNNLNNIFDENDGSLVDIVYQNNDNKIGSNNEYITGLYTLAVCSI